MIFIRTKQSDYIAKPRRRTEIQRFGREFREKLNLDPKQAFPVMDFLEHSLNDYYPDVEIIIDEEIKGAYAYYDVITKTIHLDEKVYENACDKVPRHLFTVMHEIAHMMLLEKDGCLILARRNEKVKKFQDPEWQANELAA